MWALDFTEYTGVVILARFTNLSEWYAIASARPTAKALSPNDESYIFADSFRRLT
jgi:hypothetical protein